ncbi:MAG: polysaccharide biosynthesis/export family protein [Pseudomonadota bacterium]
MVDRSETRTRPRPACRRWLALLLLFAATLAASLLPGSARAESYRLQPGDSLRLIIPGLPGGDWTATVGMGGALAFPHLGSLDAGNQTLAALRAALAARLAETVATVVSADGRLLQIPLAGAGVHLDLAGYRPVFVTGAVRQPGEIAFSPGLTVRAALARFGGLDAPVLDADALDVQRWQTLHAEATLEEAASLATLWRLAAALNRDPDAPAPPPSPEIDLPAFAALVAAERQHMRRALADIEAQEAALAQMITLSVRRADTLSRKRETYAQAVAQEEADLARMEGLFERGGLGLQRIAEMRRVLLASTTRLLEVEDGLAAEDLRRLRLVEDRRQVQIAFDTALLAQRAALVRTRLAAARRRDLAAERLALVGIDAAPAALSGERAFAVHAYRRIGPDTRLVALGPDDAVWPGDILDIVETGPGF